MDEIKFDKRNYRKHSDENKRKIGKSLDECGAGRSILIDNEGEIIAGNGVYEQAKKRGLAVRVVETDGSELVVVKRTDLATDDERRKRLALADNATSDRVEWDMDTITADFDECELGEWGIECEIEGMGEKQGKEKNEQAEELLNEAMRLNLAEYKNQLDLMLENGWIMQGLTEGVIRAKYIRAKYYNEPFAQYLSLYWCPQRFMTSASTRSVYEQICLSAREGEAGLAGFRTISEDGNLNIDLPKVGYPIGGSRLPLDFPSEMARNLMNEFSPRGGRVLDPCHGWGGAVCWFYALLLWRIYRLRPIARRSQWT